MNSIELIEVIIGLVFVVLLLSIIVSLVNEIIVTNIKLRSRVLKKSITQLLNDTNQNQEILGDKFYQHPLIKKLTKNKWILPAYVSPSTFSKVVVDILQDHQGKEGTIKDTINNLPENSETKIVLLTLLNDANCDTDKFKQNIEEWFNESMVRLSGWYKRYTQLQLFVIGCIAAIVLNVDIIHISKELSDNKEKRIQLVESARDYIRSKEDEVVTNKKTTEEIMSNRMINSNSEQNTDSLLFLLKNDEILIKEYKEKINHYEKELSNIKGEINSLSGLVGIFWEGKVTGPSTLIKAIIHAPISAYLGWLITALATSLGSAFWFDML